MTHMLFRTVIMLHVLAGSVALATFWIPVFAAKGSGIHRRSGKVFAFTMLATATTAAIAAILSAIAPLATHPDFPTSSETSIRLLHGLMLGYLAAITFVGAWSGLRTVRGKATYGGHRDPFEIAINLLAFFLAAVTFAVGLQRNAPLLIGLSMIGLIGIPGNLRVLLKKPDDPRAWMIHHLESMIGAGIAAHTAFLVFGVARIAPELSGHLLVWLAPAMIGIPATAIVSRRYKSRGPSRRVNPAPG